VDAPKLGRIGDTNCQDIPFRLFPDLPAATAAHICMDLNRTTAMDECEGVCHQVTFVHKKNGHDIHDEYYKSTTYTPDWIYIGIGSCSALRLCLRDHVAMRNMLDRIKLILSGGDNIPVKLWNQVATLRSGTIRVQYGTDTCT